MSHYDPRHGAQAPEAPHQHGLESDAWQEAIAAYLTKRQDMGPIVLRDCEYDEVTRMRYLRMARGVMS